MKGNGHVHATLPLILRFCGGYHDETILCIGLSFLNTKTIFCCSIIVTSSAPHYVVSIGRRWDGLKHHHKLS